MPNLQFSTGWLQWNLSFLPNSRDSNNKKKQVLNFFLHLQCKKKNKFKLLNYLNYSSCSGFISLCLMHLKPEIIKLSTIVLQYQLTDSGSIFGISCVSAALYHHFTGLKQTENSFFRLESQYCFKRFCLEHSYQHHQAHLAQKFAEEKRKRRGNERDFYSISALASVDWAFRKFTKI